MCKNELSEKAQLALEELLEAFMLRYAPADSWENSNIHMTSSEIAGMFNSVYPIPLDKIFDTLKENGYKCVPLPNQTVFVWLLTLN